jgi:hypothetical protein
MILQVIPSKSWNLRTSCCEETGRHRFAWLVVSTQLQGRYYGIMIGWITKTYPKPPATSLNQALMAYLSPSAGLKNHMSKLMFYCIDIACQINKERYIYKYIYIHIQIIYLFLYIYMHTLYLHIHYIHIYTLVIESTPHAMCHYVWGELLVALHRPPPRSWLQNLLKFAEAFQGKEAILAWAQWDADIHGIFVGSGHKKRYTY